jgi:hypothetical protein
MEPAKLKRASFQTNDKSRTEQYFDKQGPILTNFLPLQFTNIRNKLEYLSRASLSNLVWCFVSLAGAYQSEAPGLATNIRLAWKDLPGIDTLDNSSIQAY